MKNVVKAVSRDSYSGKQISFVRWLEVNKPEVFRPDFREEAQERRDARRPELINRKWLKSVVMSGRQFLHIEAVLPSDVHRWIVSLKDENDDAVVTDSVAKAARSATSDLFRNHGASMAYDEHTTFFAGLRRTTALAIGEGKAPAESGKAPLEFHLYCLLAFEMLRMQHNRGTIGALFLVLSWNLMCRANNTTSIRLRHIHWADDALLVFFAHAKTDQEGKLKKYPRHLYANPVNPQICVITLLGVHLLSFPFISDEGALCDETQALLEGNSQYHRCVFVSVTVCRVRVF